MKNTVFAEMKIKMLLAAVVLAAMVSCRSDKWTALLDEYSENEKVGQLIFVKCTEGSNAVVEFYVRDAKGKWSLRRREPGFIGRNGLGKEVEGDKKTPEGNFHIRCAFGILPNPGTTIEYIDVKETTYACTDLSEDAKDYYNTIIDVEETGHDCHGEHMITVDPAYNYGLATDYNPGNIQGLGSAIFFHCTGPVPSTSGCVAVSQDFMREILVDSDSGLVICIHRM